MAPKKPTSTNPDDQITELFSYIKKQREEIVADERKPTYQTNLTWSYTDGNLNQSLNLATVQDPATLLKVAAFLQSMSTAYDAIGASVYGADGKVPEFKWCGHPASEWLHDIKILVKRILVKSKKERLATLEARLDAIVSPEMRTRLELAAIAGELGKPGA